MAENEGEQVQALLRCLLDHERVAATFPHIVVCRAEPRGEHYYGPYPDRRTAEEAAVRLACAGTHSARLHQPVPLLDPEFAA